MGKGRAPCCDKNKVKKGPWSPAEDLRLISFIHNHGHGNWRALPKQAGLLRCGKSCRLRWINYLRPDVKRGSFTPQEEETIINLHTSIGNKWSKIASHLPGRTDNEIKNVWNTYLKKRALKKAEETSASSSHSPSCSIITSCGDQKNMDKGSHDQELIKINQQKENVEDSSSSYASSFSWYNNIDGGNNPTRSQPLEIPLEKDDIDDFWNILDSLETSQEPSNLVQSCENGHGEARFDKILGEDSEEKLEHNRWLRNLEYELGLVAQSGGIDNIMPMPDQCSIVFDIDAQYQIF